MDRICMTLYGFTLMLTLFRDVCRLLTMFLDVAWIVMLVSRVDSIFDEFPQCCSIVAMLHEFYLVLHDFDTGEMHGTARRRTETDILAWNREAHFVGLVLSQASKPGRCKFPLRSTTSPSEHTKPTKN